MKVCIIPAAGKGIRFRELGKLYPKSLLPYKNKPIIFYIIKSIYKDFDEIRIITDHQSLEIKKYINFLNLKKIKIINLDKKKHQGPAKSMYCGLQSNEKSILMLLSDAIYNFNFLKENKFDWVSVMQVKDYSRWCLIDKKNNLYDKPQNKVATNLAISGAYHFTNPKFLKKCCEKIFANLSTKTEIQFSHVLELYKKKHKIKLIEHNKKNIKDFGTIEQFFQNKNNPISRSFNIIKINQKNVVKTSIDYPDKILREAMWIKYAPRDIQHLLPKVFSIDVINSTFTAEKISSPTLREIFLYIDKSFDVWIDIFEELNKFINYSKTIIKKGHFWSHIIEKNLIRTKKNNLFLDEFKKRVENSDFYNQVTFYHGDLVFSNIFYDLQKKQLKFIDPRGEFYGHWLYDIAKIYQCVYGRYEYVDSQLYTFQNNLTFYYDKGNNFVKKAFEDVILSKLSKKELDFIKILVASLYLSLIPLHNHNKINQKLYYEEYLRFKKHLPI
jgi:dTDP-glucose pyrophosphorylase